MGGWPAGVYGSSSAEEAPRSPRRPLQWTLKEGKRQPSAGAIDSEQDTCIHRGATCTRDGAASSARYAPPWPPRRQGGNAVASWAGPPPPCPWGPPASSACGRC